jgi:surfeit locus 1 family protein
MRFRFSSQALFSAHWWVLLLATVCMTALTVRLGFWQLGRAQFKEAAFAQEQARAALPVLTNDAFVQPLLPYDGVQRRVDVEGEWLPQWTVFLDNRSMQGQPGFWVLTPLQLAPGRILLVQRGWAPRDPVQSDKLPPIETPPGRVRVQGRWVPPPSQMMELSATAPSASMSGGFRTLRQNIVLSEFAHETGLIPVATVLQTGGASEGLQRNWPIILSGADKNRAYALQWFALATLCVGLFVWFQIIQKIRHG